MIPDRHCEERQRGSNPLPGRTSWPAMTRGKPNRQIDAVPCKASFSIAVTVFRVALGLAETFRHHGEMDLVLKARVLAPRNHFGVVADDGAQRINPAAIAFGKITEHIVLHHVLIAGMTDPDADAAVIIADMFGDRTQSVMPGDAAADFHPHLAWRQIDLVVKHGDVRRRQFVKMRGFGDRPAGFIHIGAGQQQKRARAAERSFAGDAGKAPAPRAEAVALGNLLNGEEADIVPVTDIARSRIAESNQEQHATTVLSRTTSLL